MENPLKGLEKKNKARLLNEQSDLYLKNSTKVGILGLVYSLAAVNLPLFIDNTNFILFISFGSD
jgi:hypothetical protein